MSHVTYMNESRHTCEQVSHTSNAHLYVISQTNHGNTHTPAVVASAVATKILPQPDENLQNQLHINFVS